MLWILSPCIGLELNVDTFWTCMPHFDIVSHLNYFRFKCLFPPGLFSFLYLNKLSLFNTIQFKSIQFNPILLYLQKNMFKIIVIFELFQVQVYFSTMVLGYFIFFIWFPIQFNSIQFYFIYVSKKIMLRNFQFWSISGLRVFSTIILFYFLYLITLVSFNSIQFKSIHFCSI